MANVYVRSGAAGTGTGADWTNAYTTLAAAFTAKAAGDNFWVSEDHAETAASAKTMSSPGTAAAPCTAICVNHAGTVPPVSADIRTTATITTTGANQISIDGFVYFYGIAFNSGSGAVSTPLELGGLLGNGGAMIFQNCALNKNGTSGNTSAIKLRDSPQFTRFINTSLGFGDASAGDAVDLEGRHELVWSATSTPITGTIPAYIFRSALSGNWQGTLTLTGLDFSAAGYATVNIMYPYGNASNVVYRVQNCKFNSGLTLLPASIPDPNWGTVYKIVTDSTGTNYQQEKYNYYGQQVAETTIVRTGGATDGATPISWKITTGSGSAWNYPYESIPMAVWNPTTAGNVTVTVFGIWGGGAVPNNDDIWIEVSYLGASGGPIATINTANTKANFIATGTGQSTDTSTWGGSTTKFKMAVTLSSPQPALAGPIYVTVKAAKASSTFYVDPKVVLS